MIVLQVAAQARLQSPPSSSTAIRGEREAFLSKGRIVTDAPPDRRRSWRVSLDDGIRRHDASVETADGRDPTRRDYRFNVAAYDLDKLLDLDLVPPSIERAVGGRPASLTWWVDDVAMNELDRRRRTIDPPDPESWSRQMAAVRVFDELISNTYRDTSPGLYLNTVWDNLLITKDWTIWIIDHTAAFRVRQGLADSESLNRCPRTLLATLRGLNRDQFQRALGKHLSPQQLDALEMRRALLVKHFNKLVASRGEATVLFDLGNYHYDVR
jgi:hypothetical protein